MLDKKEELMAKKLDSARVLSELSDSVFFRDYRKQQSPPPPLPPVVDTPADRNPQTQIHQEKPVISDRPTARPDDEATNRSTDHPTGKRLLVRRGFEWWEDQLAALKKLSLEEQMAGEPGSMSAMVREALDDYLKKRAAKESTG
jgi:hypothetical protein